MAALNLHRWGGCRRIYVPPLPFCGVSPSERQITGMGKAAETRRNKWTAEAEVPLQVIYFKPTSIRHLWCFHHRNFISEALSLYRRYWAAYVEHIAAIDSRAINRTAHFHRPYRLVSQVGAALCPCRKDCFLSFFLPFFPPAATVKSAGGSSLFANRRLTRRPLFGCNTWPAWQKGRKGAGKDISVFFSFFH